MTEPVYVAFDATSTHMSGAGFPATYQRRSSRVRYPFKSSRPVEITVLASLGCWRRRSAGRASLPPKGRLPPSPRAMLHEFVAQSQRGEVHVSDTRTIGNNGDRLHSAVFRPRRDDPPAPWAAIHERRAGVLGRPPGRARRTGLDDHDLRLVPGAVGRAERADRPGLG